MDDSIDMEVLRKQRETGEHTDVVVDVGGERFPCHKIILAMSPFFMSIFEGGAQQSFCGTPDEVASHSDETISEAHDDDAAGASPVNVGAASIESISSAKDGAAADVRKGYRNLGISLMTKCDGKLLIKLADRGGPHLRPKSFKALLEFLYAKTARLGSMRAIKRMISVASFFQIHELDVAIAQRVTQIVDDDNVKDLLTARFSQNASPFLMESIASVCKAHCYRRTPELAKELSRLYLSEQEHFFTTEDAFFLHEYHKYWTMIAAHRARRADILLRMFKAQQRLREVKYWQRKREKLAPASVPAWAARLLDGEDSCSEASSESSSSGSEATNAHASDAESIAAAHDAMKGEAHDTRCADARETPASKRVQADGTTKHGRRKRGGAPAEELRRNKCKRRRRNGRTRRSASRRKAAEKRGTDVDGGGGGGAATTDGKPRDDDAKKSNCIILDSSALVATDRGDATAAAAAAGMEVAPHPATPSAQKEASNPPTEVAALDGDASSPLSHKHAPSALSVETGPVDLPTAKMKMNNLSRKIEDCKADLADTDFMFKRLYARLRFVHMPKDQLRAVGSDEEVDSHMLHDARNQQRRMEEVIDAIDMTDVESLQDLVTANVCDSGGKPFTLEDVALPPARFGVEVDMTDLFKLPFPMRHGLFTSVESKYFRFAGFLWQARVMRQRATDRAHDNLSFSIISSIFKYSRIKTNISVRFMAAHGTGYAKPILMSPSHATTTHDERTWSNIIQCEHLEPRPWRLGNVWRFTITVQIL